MAANDEFPNKWITAIRTDGTEASITIPAITGVTHILTDVIVGMTALAALSFNAPIEVSSGGTPLFTVAGTNSLVETASNFTAVDDNAQFSWSGKVTGLYGANLVIDTFTGVVNLVQSLVIMGYDI